MNIKRAVKLLARGSTEPPLTLNDLDRRVLSTLAYYRVAIPNDQLSVMSFSHFRSKKFEDCIKKLTSLEYIFHGAYNGNGGTAITQIGLDELGEMYVEPYTDKELMRQWIIKLGEKSRLAQILTYLWLNHDGRFTKKNISASVKIPTSGGACAKHLTNLWSMGLVERFALGEHECYSINQVFLWGH